MKLIVDIVPNHTSNRHEWFRQALASPPGSPARDRYVFRDGNGPDGAEPPSDWPSFFGGSAWDPGPRRPVVPAPVRPGAARPQLGQPRGPGGLPDHAAVLVRPRRRRVPGRRGPPAGQGRSTEPFRGPGRARRLETFRTAATRSRTGTRCTRSTPNGGGVQRVRPAAHRRSPRRGCTPAGARVRQPGGARPGLQLRPAAVRFRRGELPPVIDRQPGDGRQSGASSTWVFSNHDVVRHATRYGLPKAADGASDGKPGCSATATTPALDVELGMRRARAATLLMLALPGSATSTRARNSACTRSATCRPTPCRTRRSSGQGRGEGPRRLPGPAAVDRRRAVVRVRRRAARTCRSRSGSAPTPSSGSWTSPRRPCTSTSRRSPRGGRCRAPEELTWRTSTAGRGRVRAAREDGCR